MDKELRDKVNKWFEKNYTRYLNEVRTNITKGIMSDYTDDICGFMYTEFLKQKPEKIEQMLRDDKVMNWMLRGTSFQIKSSSSPFYSKYRSKRANLVPEYFGEGAYHQHDNIELDDYYQCMMYCLEDENSPLDWYQKKIVEMKYIRQYRYSDMADKYGFSMASLKKHIVEALDIIEEYCNNKIER